MPRAGYQYGSECRVRVINMALSVVEGFINLLLSTVEGWMSERISLDLCGGCQPIGETERMVVGRGQRGGGVRPEAQGGGVQQPVATYL